MSPEGRAMGDFNAFLDHIMKNFSASFPYGLSKTEVTRLTFLAYCLREAETFKKEVSAEVTP